jgi:hypothetical protein
VDEAKLKSEFEMKTKQLERKVFLDELYETVFELEMEEQLKRQNSYELDLKPHLKDGDITAKSKTCYEEVKTECEVNGVAAAKKAQTDCVRREVLDLAKTLKMRSVDDKEQKNFEKATHDAREMQKKEWPAYIVSDDRS